MHDVKKLRGLPEHVEHTILADANAQLQRSKQQEEDAELERIIREIRFSGIMLVTLAYGWSAVRAAPPITLMSPSPLGIYLKLACHSTLLSKLSGAGSDRSVQSISSSRSISP
jgi:hypothetical protein